MSAGSRRDEKTGIEAERCWVCSVSVSWTSEACSQTSSEASIRSRDVSSCSFILARSWMFLAEHSIWADRWLP